jgi:succinate dehydrogenase/fumarate reductase flavoprotein subunit
VKEDLPTADVGHWIVKQGNENVWVIFSSADVPEGIGTATGNFTFKALFEAGLAADGLNEVKKADTIEALAAAIGAPKLAATVAAYNSSASTDAAFGKAPQYLANKYLRNGPFYAVQVYANAWGSMGGVVTDDSGRALRVDGSVIPHLYAVGEMANRDFYGETYIGGSSLALYSTMGRRAGAAAAKDD